MGGKLVITIQSFLIGNNNAALVTGKDKNFLSTTKLSSFTGVFVLGLK